MERYFVYAVKASDKTKKEKMIQPEVVRLEKGLIECKLEDILEHFKAIVKEANERYTGKDLEVRLTGTRTDDRELCNRYLRILADGEYDDRFSITFVPIRSVIKAL